MKNANNVRILLEETSGLKENQYRYYTTITHNPVDSSGSTIYY